jgi:hypothetical protein
LARLFCFISQLFGFNLYKKYIEFSQLFHTFLENLRKQNGSNPLQGIYMEKSQKVKNNINKTLKNFWLDIIIFFAFVIDMNVHLTGLVIHEWLGVGLGVIVVIHLLFHWEWIECTVKKFLTALSGLHRFKSILDIALFLDFVALGITGLMISKVVMRLLGIQTARNSFWRGLHVASADWLIFLIGLHLAINWRWVVNILKRVFRIRLPQPRKQEQPDSRRCEMKIIIRKLIILFFVAIVVAGTYALGTSNGANAFVPTGGQFGGWGRNQTDFFSQEDGHGFRRGQYLGSGGGDQNHFDMEGTINSLTIFEFLKTLIPFTIIIAFVSLMRKALDSARRKRKR